MRRRYGIPDNDLRPFSVAFAAAKRAQQERQASERGLSRKQGMGYSGFNSTALQRHTPTWQRQDASGTHVVIPFVPLALNRSPAISRPQHSAGEGAVQSLGQPSYLQSHLMPSNTVPASEFSHPMYVPHTFVSRQALMLLQQWACQWNTEHPCHCFDCARCLCSDTSCGQWNRLC